MILLTLFDSLKLIQRLLDQLTSHVMHPKPKTLKLVHTSCEFGPTIDIPLKRETKIHQMLVVPTIFGVFHILPPSVSTISGILPRRKWDGGPGIQFALR